MSAKMWAIGNDHGVHGGTLETLVETSLTADALGSETLSQHCVDLADLCSQRAVMCDDYTDQLAQWGRSVDAWELRRDDWANQTDKHTGPRSPGPRPQRPTPPATWVEAG